MFFFCCWSLEFCIVAILSAYKPSLIVDINGNCETWLKRMHKRKAKKKKEERANKIFVWIWSLVFYVLSRLRNFCGQIYIQNKKNTPIQPRKKRRFEWLSCWIETAHQRYFVVSRTTKRSANSVVVFSQFFFCFASKINETIMRPNTLAIATLQREHTQKFIR